MPAQKRSLPDSLDEGDTSQQNLFHSRHAKQQQQDQSQEHDEDENEDEEGEDGEEEEGEEEGEGEGEEDEEEEEEEEVEEAAQHDNNDKEKPQVFWDLRFDSMPLFLDRGCFVCMFGISSCLRLKLVRSLPAQKKFVYVELLEIRKDVQCPICLDGDRDTDTNIDVFGPAVPGDSFLFFGEPLASGSTSLSALLHRHTLFIHFPTTVVAFGNTFPVTFPADGPTVRLVSPFEFSRVSPLTHQTTPIPGA
ncbi:hypothetical protein JHK85_035221 [Glycine max]|nr:hypothetical protein JHK85_035221 [Glycine max]